MIETAAADPREWKRRLRMGRDGAYWREYTTLLLERARGRTAADLRPEMKHYVSWVDYSSRNHDSVDAELLTELIEEFARLITNLGEPGDASVSVLSALERSIELQERGGRPTSGLHLARASYLGTLANDSPEREAAIEKAVACAVPGSAEWARAKVSLASYQTVVSRYDRALVEADELRRELRGGPLAAKYECAALYVSGVAMGTSFQNLRGAERSLLRACEFEDQSEHDSDIAGWVSGSYHYLGRLAEVRRRHRTALDLYIYAERLKQERCPESIGGSAFYHLRVAELLMGAGLLDEAGEHLDRSMALFRASSEQSSGILQADLASATLAAARGRFTQAEAMVEETRQSARTIGFWRGELLCLGYLLTLHVRRGRLYRVPVDLWRIVATARRGELSRNSIAQLLAKIPFALPVPLRRMSRRGGRRDRGPNAIQQCACPLHAGRA